MRFLSTLILSATLFIVSGNAFAQENVSIDEFREVHASCPFKVKLIKSDKVKMTVDYNGLDEDDFEVRQYGKSLELKIRNKSIFNKENDYDRYVIVEIHFVELEEINSSMGASIKSSDIITGDELNITANMGGVVKFQVDIHELDLTVNMGGVIELTGKAKETLAESNMGGEVLLDEMVSRNAYVKANMGSVIKVLVDKELEATANFGGVIYYYGSPEFVDTSSIMGGEIKNRTTRN